MGLPSLKIRFRTNQHPSLHFPSHVDDVFFALNWEDLTCTNPGDCFWASIVDIILISSLIVCDGCLTGFSILLLGRGFVVRGFIWAIPCDVALLVAGETVPCLALFFHVFWGCGACSSFGSISVCRTISVCLCIHGIWIERRHLDFQDLG